MFIDTVQRIDRVTVARVANEVARWGMPRGAAEQVIEEVLEAMPEAAQLALEETTDVPSAVTAVVESQTALLTHGTPRTSRTASQRPGPHEHVDTFVGLARERGFVLRIMSRKKRIRFRRAGRTTDTPGYGRRRQSEPGSR
jgi:hypothetical protein